MTDHKLLISEQREGMEGEIVISPEVMEIIIGIAASKVEGVYSMQGSLASNVHEWLGRKVSHDKGVSLSQDEEGNLIVDLYCYVRYGVSVPKVAIAMQNAVKQQVRNMTDFELKEVNIHVVGMVPDSETELPTGEFSTLTKEEEE